MLSNVSRRCTRRAKYGDAPQVRPLRIAMIGLRGIPATYGGVEMAVEELVHELAARGHQITVYCRRGYASDSPATEGAAELIVLPFIPTKHLEAISHTFLAVSHAILRRRFDIVHFHATGPTLLSFMARLRGITTVSTVQGLDWRREKWGAFASTVLKLGAWVSARVPHLTIAVSQELSDELARLGAKHSVRIPNGVRPPALLELAGQPHALEQELEHDKPIILFLGRLVPEKHVVTLIRAFADADLEAQLVVAGPSSNSDAYVRSVETEANGDDRVHVVGPQYGTAKEWLLQNATIFVQPSSIEGLPLALLEAISRGAFPVVSDIPPNVEAVSCDGSRITPTVPVGDEVALRDALRTVLAMPSRDRHEAVVRLQENMRTEYSWPRIAAATEAAYYRAMMKAPA